MLQVGHHDEDADGACDSARHGEYAVCVTRKIVRAGCCYIPKADDDGFFFPCQADLTPYVLTGQRAAPTGVHADDDGLYVLIEPGLSYQPAIGLGTDVAL